METTSRKSIRTMQSILAISVALVASTRLYRLDPSPPDKKQREHNLFLTAGYVKNPRDCG